MHNQFKAFQFKFELYEHKLNHLLLGEQLESTLSFDNQSLNLAPDHSAFLSLFNFPLKQACQIYSPQQVSLQPSNTTRT